MTNLCALRRNQEIVVQAFSRCVPIVTHKAQAEGLCHLLSRMWLRDAT